MATTTTPQDLVGAVEEAQNPVSAACGTGRECGSRSQGYRHRPWGLVERWGLAYARGHNQPVIGAMGTPEPPRSSSDSGAALLNRRVRSRTHGGVGGRRG